VEIMCSLRLAVRIGFWLAAIAFVLGLVIGYRVGITTVGTGATGDHLGDIRSISRICYAERSEARCTPVPSSSLWSSS
jgi:hypothetical protein